MKILGNNLIKSKLISISSPSTTLLLLHGEAFPIKDSSIYHNSIRNTDLAIISSDQKKFGESSIYFNGRQSCSVTSPLFTFGLNDFCIEMFVYWNQTNFSGEPGIFQLSNNLYGLQPSYVNSLGIATTIVEGVPKYFLIANNTTYNSNTTVTPGLQVYAALKRETRNISGVDRRITSLWINGSEVVSIEDNTNYNFSDLCLGGYYDTYYLGNFYLDEFRVSSISQNTSVIPSSPFL